MTSMNTYLKIIRTLLVIITVTAIPLVFIGAAPILVLNILLIVSISKYILTSQTRFSIPTSIFVGYIISCIVWGFGWIVTISQLDAFGKSIQGFGFSKNAILVSVIVLLFTVSLIVAGLQIKAKKQ